MRAMSFISERGLYLSCMMIFSTYLSCRGGLAGLSFPYTISLVPKISLQLYTSLRVQREARSSSLRTGCTETSGSCEAQSPRETLHKAPQRRAFLKTSPVSPSLTC